MTTQNKTWLITGAGRGMGLDIAKAALAAGHNVVATGRNPDAVAEALGEADNLLVVELDVTSSADAVGAVEAAVDRFGGIDVLVNNAASFYAHSATQARDKGWAVAEIAGVGHLAMASDPIAVTDTLLDLERALSGSR
jgi:NAD(P)-dependent dehydrogenase (short-subunit alcohol dehydrogenase family)